SLRSFRLSRRYRALWTAALLGLGICVGMASAQVDIEAVRTRAGRGEPEALNALGNAYANGVGVPKDDATAIRYYEEAAQRGFAPASFNLGMMRELGRGVPADMAAAFTLYMKAAEQGFGPAQFNVGNMYANGIGVAQDFFESALWF